MTTIEQVIEFAENALKGTMEQRKSVPEESKRPLLLRAGAFLEILHNFAPEKEEEIRNLYPEEFLL